MSSAMLRVVGLQKHFFGLRAVEDVSLTVAPKQIVGLMGPNGAGKTTLFNLITALLPPDAGDIWFNDASILRMKPWQIAHRGLARTFQNTRLIPDMNVLENVLVPISFRDGTLGIAEALSLGSSHSSSDVDHAKELVNFFGMSAELHTLAGSLPYGAQRRVEIARALMLHPKILLLDEPAAGLNSHEAQELGGWVHELRERFNLAVILIDHNLSLLMNVSEYVYCMDQGQIIAQGRPDEVHKHPKVRQAYLGQ